MKTHINSKNRAGRPRGPDWYDSFKQASTALGVPIGDLKWAKSQACPHIRGNRVFAGVVKWIEENPATTPDKERLECQRIEKQNRKLDFEHQLRLEQYVPSEKVKTMMMTMADVVQGAMKQFMTTSDYNACIKLIKANGQKLTDL